MYLIVKKLFMKHFLRIKRADKKNIKMINQTESGFCLVITSDNVLNDILNKINSYNNNDEIDIVWQMKFKNDNYIIYKKCIFSNPEINYFTQRGKMPVVLGKRIKVSCSGVQYYSNSFAYKNHNVKNTKHIYKDAHLLERMLKISELNSKEE